MNTRNVKFKMNLSCEAASYEEVCAAEVLEKDVRILVFDPGCNLEYALSHRQNGKDQPLFYLVLAFGLIKFVGREKFLLDIVTTFVHCLFGISLGYFLFG